jgi:hypothetical protein
LLNKKNNNNNKKHRQPSKRPNKQSGYGARYPPSHLLKEAKGVWLEMGDNMGHFMDVIFTQSQVNSNPLPPSR